MIDNGTATSHSLTASPLRERFSLSGIGSSLLLVSAATALSAVVSQFLAPTNLVMIYLLAVVMAALKSGRYPAMLTALLGVLTFDFFFVPPRFSLTVANTEYLVTFLALFIVGVVISTLVAETRERTEALRIRERQSAFLYHLSSDLAVSVDSTAIFAAVLRNVENALGGKLIVLLPCEEQLEVAMASDAMHLDYYEQTVASWVYRTRTIAGRGADNLETAANLYLPLQTASSVLGVLGVWLPDADSSLREYRTMLESFAVQTAMALERVRFAKQAEQAQLLQARENLERALLNSISHDLRTPLSTITGALTGLKHEVDHLTPCARLELIESALEEADRLNRFVGNLLEMTRLEAGQLLLNRELNDIQDLIGCALAPFDARTDFRSISVNLSPGLPLVPMDLVLMTHVLVNLLENTLKYSPSGTPVEIIARIDAPWLILEVADRGHGVLDQDLKRIFDKFYRIPEPERAGGTGLGLSICKGIVEAHGGAICAENRTGGGLRISIKLPLGQVTEENSYAG